MGDRQCPLCETCCLFVEGFLLVGLVSLSAGANKAGPLLEGLERGPTEKPGLGLPWLEDRAKRTEQHGFFASGQ